MASREEIQALRDLARQRHRAATRKVSRLKAKGVNVEAAKLDPRKDPASFKRLNAKQLEAHIARLNKFVSRETQFVTSAHKTQPLTGGLWHEYKALERAVNQRNAKPYEGVKNIFLPSLGMTVDEFQGTKPTHPVTGNPASRAPHLPINKTNKGVPNDKQLKKLIKDMKARLQPEYGDKVIRREHRTLSTFLNTIGKVNQSDDFKFIQRNFKTLTTAQFAFMWNYTNFANISGFDYEIAKSKLSDPTSMAQFDAAFDTQIREMKKIIKDVKTLNL